MKNLKKSLKNTRVITMVGGVVTSVVMSGSAMAADYTAQIATATTEGTANTTAVIAGVIGLAILGFGVGHMLGWFKR
jgi:hypothetical protein